MNHNTVFASHPNIWSVTARLQDIPQINLLMLVNVKSIAEGVFSSG